jgi:hypothetical protein
LHCVAARFVTLVVDIRKRRNQTDYDKINPETPTMVIRLASVECIGVFEIVGVVKDVEKHWYLIPLALCDVAGPGVQLESHHLSLFTSGFASEPEKCKK